MPYIQHLSMACCMILPVVYFLLHTGPALPLFIYYTQRTGCCSGTGRTRNSSRRNQERRRRIKNSKTGKQYLSTYIGKKAGPSIEIATANCLLSLQCSMRLPLLLLLASRIVRNRGAVGGGRTTIGKEREREKGRKRGGGREGGGGRCELPRCRLTINKQRASP